MKAAQQKQQQKPAKDSVCVWGANKSEAKKQFLLLVAAICWPTRQNSQTVERSRSAGRKEEAAKSNKKQLHEGSRNCLPASSVPAASRRKEKSQKKWRKKKENLCWLSGLHWLCLFPLTRQTIASVVAAVATVVVVVVYVIAAGN